MARPIKWGAGTFKKFKLKLQKEKAARYQKFLEMKEPPRTVQRDFEDHVEKILSE